MSEPIYFSKVEFKERLIYSHIRSSMLLDLVQGLVAVTDYPQDKALYINIAKSAPHYIGKNKQYEDVGGHLFAIAVNESVKKGYGRFLFMDAKNLELVKYYHEKFGATLLGTPHPYRIFIDENNAKKLLKFIH